MQKECQDPRKEDDEHDSEGDPASRNPIFFPPRSQDDERSIVNNDDQPDDDFHRACRLAVETKRPLHLTVSFLRMKETVVLRRQETLVIIGCRDSAVETTENDMTTTLQGDLHSLFVLNNFSQLTLRYITLNHTLEPTNAAAGGGGDHRQVGAAVNLRKKSRLDMQVGNLHSTCGFCLWIVQKSHVTLQNCKLTATLRSPLVCFGQPTVHLANCQIVDAGVHALCARGECQVKLEDCQITGSASRAIYAYAQASLTLVRTIVMGTIRHDKAAIEVSASSGNDDDNNKKNDPNAPKKPSKKGKSGHLKIPLKSTLIMNDCKVCDNQGIGILIRGDVDHTFTNTEYTGNAMGNIVETTALQDDDKASSTPLAIPMASSNSTTANSNAAASTDNGTPPTSISGLKRDASGSSSFRQGDWWCPKCYQDWYHHHHHHNSSSVKRTPTIVMAGINKCPTCGLDALLHHDDDDDDSVQQRQQQQAESLGLTVQEIAGLNRGMPIEIRKGLLVLSLRRMVEDNGKSIIISTPVDNKRHHQWMFDGDDKGWIPYDADSNTLLEEAFQRRLGVKHQEAAVSAMPPIDLEEEDHADDPDDEDKNEETKRSASGLLVTLCQGRYQVDLEKMQQVNVQSQMLRFVKRVEVVAAAESKSNSSSSV